MERPRDSHQGWARAPCPDDREADGGAQAVTKPEGHCVLWDRKGTPLSQKEGQVLMRRVGRKANVKPGVHRHTFCSHLAMRGAPAKAIQELAGHQDLATTQQYMHLSPAALDAAIRLLEMGTRTSSGKSLEAAGTGSVTA